MDGGGRLEQPLMRSGQLGAKGIGAPVDEPDLARAQSDDPSHFANGIFAFFGNRRRIRRWLAKVANAPPGFGVAGSILLISATLAYGTVAGGHVTAISGWLREVRDAAANSAGFREIRSMT